MSINSGYYFFLYTELFVWKCSVGGTQLVFFLFYFFSFFFVASLFIFCFFLKTTEVKEKTTKVKEKNRNTKKIMQLILLLKQQLRFYKKTTMTIPDVAVCPTTCVRCEASSCQLVLCVACVIAAANTGVDVPMVKSAALVKVTPEVVNMTTVVVPALFSWSSVYQNGKNLV